MKTLKFNSFKKLNENKKNDTLTLKHKKETDKELAHTDILLNKECIGYMIPITSKAATIGDNYNIQFTYNEEKYIKNFSSRKKAIEFLEKTTKLTIS